MKIVTEAERLSHPQAMLIPKSLMMGFMSGDLPEAFIQLMKTNTFKSLLAGLNAFALPQSEYKRQCLWLAIVYSHPGLTVKQLAKLAELTGLSPKKHLEASIAFNHSDYLAHVLTLHDYSGVLAQEKTASDLFVLAALYGCIDMLIHLESKAAPDKLQSWIAAHRFFIFKGAASNGHLEVLRYLESKAPDKLQEMIATGDLGVGPKFAPFHFAALNGHLKVLRYLESKAPDKLQEMIASNGFMAFREAVSNHHSDVYTHLLSYASIFTDAEEYYGELIKRHLKEQLINLRQRKQDYERAHPNAVFDVASDEEGDLFFYYARQLIRRNKPELRDELLLLLELPGVKHRAARSVRGGAQNELLRLALSVNNCMAAKLLLDIPAVHREAEARNYYQAEQLGDLNLRQLAQDKETALSQGERVRLKEVMERYQPLLDAAGVNQCMEALREDLIARYEGQPATIVVSSGGQNKTVILPLKWSEFKALHLGEADYSTALKAYYSHPTHSAWRYLLKPNPWMHQKADYVNVNPQDRSEKYSTFEEYQPLISMFYLAAIDSQVPDVEARTTHFIEELALLGRAHNWGDSRLKRNAQGRLVREEYDNLEGDRPRCLSGVERALQRNAFFAPAPLPHNRLNSAGYEEEKADYKK